MTAQKIHMENVVNDASDLIKSISRLTKSLYYTENIDQMLDLLHAEIKQQFGFNLIWLYEFVDNQQAKIKLMGVKGAMKHKIEQNYPVIHAQNDQMIENIFEQNMPVYIEDARVDPTTDKRMVKAWGNRTLINCQLFIKGKSIGTLGTGSFYDEGVKPMSSQDIAYFESLANALSIALDRINYKTISMLDPLTGLDNKRALEINANTLLRLAKRNKQKAAVIFIDLDNFKPANDQYGHAFGDNVLKLFAAGLKKILRASDIKARYGGDEFVLILPSIKDESSVKKVIDNISAHCTKITMGEISYQVQFSAGWSVYPYDGQNIHELITQADYRMYSDKASNKFER